MRIGRFSALLLVFLLVAAGVAGYVYLAYGPSSRLPALESTAGAALPAAGGVTAEPPPSPTVIYFRYTGLDTHYGNLARTGYGSDAPPEFLAALSCEVVHVSGGRGLCLSADRGVMTTYKGIIFDTTSLAVVAEVPLDGVPSRCRVARDGRRAALTVFVSGHGYASVEFSTQTLLIDLATGAVEADLESFAVSKDGVVVQAGDRNFWGVTFASDSRYFYATMATGGEHYLIHGDAEERTARVIRQGVECPSLSPDGRLIAFKQRVPDSPGVQWQIAVLELASGQQQVLDEARSVDDQIEWLDDERLLYSMPGTDGRPGASTDVWVARADRGSPPQLFLGNAYSPAVLR